jgi:CheY-like chemotaxis protein
VIRAIEHVLQRFGYDIRSASTAPEALALMRLQRPCVVLLNMHLPLADAIQFRALQLSEPGLADIPVVCLTAHRSTVPEWRTLGLPMLQKPVSSEELLWTVHSYA